METQHHSKAFPVVLPISHWLELTQDSKEEGRSNSAAIRELLAEYLRKKRRAAKAKEGAA